MSRFPSLVGRAFDRLTVVGLAGKGKRGRSLWACRCACGNEIAVPSYNLQSGNTRSCGCLADEVRRRRFSTHGFSRDESGKMSRLYGVWLAMRRRCHRPSDPGYHNYGGRGISVCEEWTGYKAFHDWAMTSGYRRGLNIDRIDNDGDYTPSNCRWVDRKTQQRNTRANHRISYRGTERPLVEWSEILGIAACTLRARLRSGWSVEQALGTRVKEAY